MAEHDSHSMIGASSSHRWINCPGSVRLSMGVPAPKPTKAAATGTIAHRLGEISLKGNLSPSEYIGQTFTQDGFEVEVTQEMADAVAVYVGKVNDDRKKHGGSICVEQMFSLDWLYPGLFGTNDACLVSSWGGTLRIYDYKHGVTPVQAHGNTQLMYYALGALSSLQSLWPDSVVCTIVQPNCPGKDAIDSWEVGTGELMSWGRDVLAPAARRTADPNAPCHPGPWCRWCPALAACGKKHGEVLAHVGGTPEKLVLPDTVTMSPDAIGRAAAFFTSTVFTQWLAAVTEAEMALLRRGVRIQGRRLVERTSYGNRKWADEAATAEALKDLVGDAFYERKAKSPAQVEKLITSRKLLKKAELADVIAPLVTREITTRQVVESAGAEAGDASLLLSTPLPENP